MRLFCLLFLLVMGGAVGIFAYQNLQDITLTFLNFSLTAPVAAVIGAAYGLGMLSGWTVLGIIRRSVERVAEYPERRQQAPAR